METKALDHVALWVADRDRIADFLTTRLGMHVIERTDAFTLVGWDARRGKLTLFAAEGPRERGALKHVALRVRGLGGTDGKRELDLGDGLRVLLVEGGGEHDLDHVALYARDPDDAARQYQALGFRPAERGASGARRVEAGGSFLELHAGDAVTTERPLLNHLGVLVESADDQLAEAEELGLEVADVVNAANTYAVFVWGPDRVKIEYVEHKPSFSLA